MGETGSSNSTLDEISHLLYQHFERTLNTVINTRSEVLVLLQRRARDRCSTGSPGLMPECILRPDDDIFTS